MMNIPHLPHQIRTFPHLFPHLENRTDPHRRTPPYRGAGVRCGRIAVRMGALECTAPHRTLKGDWDNG